MQEILSNTEVFLSVRQLECRGYGSTATIWRRVKARTFPAPVKLSAGMTRWRASDIETWTVARVALSEGSK